MAFIALSPWARFYRKQKLRLREADLSKVMWQTRGRVWTQDFNSSTCSFLLTLALNTDVGGKWDGGNTLVP